MHAALKFFNLHSSCEYKVTSSLDVCQVVSLLLIKLTFIPHECPYL